LRRRSRFHIVSGLLASLLLLVGAVQLLAAAATLADPLFASLDLSCDPGCGFDPDPVRLLATEQARIAAWTTPGFERQILERLSSPGVPTMLFAAQAARAVPLFLVLMSLAMALHSLGSAGFDRAGVRWLRRAAHASLVWIVAASAATSLQASAFAPLQPGRGSVVIALHLPLWQVAVSAALWIALWGVEEALELRSEVEAYV
jgi:hypothetical protein